MLYECKSPEDLLKIRGPNSFHTHSANLINIGANPRWGERVSDEHRTAGQSTQQERGPTITVI